MAVAAPILPPALDQLDLPNEVRTELVAAWASWWEPLRDDLRSAPPAPDSSLERIALARFAGGLVALVARFGPALQPLLRAGFAKAFEDLVAREDEQADTIRRLGVKLLRRAVEVLGELYEAAVVFAAPPLSLERTLPSTDEDIALLLDAQSIALLRLELTVFVAFDLTRDEPLEEFTQWARLAHMAAQRALGEVGLAQRKPPEPRIIAGRGPRAKGFLEDLAASRPRQGRLATPHPFHPWKPPAPNPP